MKDKAIIRMKLDAERNLAISDGALRLLLRIGSHIYVNPKIKTDQSFPLPWSKVALWCGCAEEAAYSRIKELKELGFLKCDGLHGCPGTQHFFLVPSSLKKQGTGSGENQGARAVKNQGTDSGENQGHHISNSFQEEKIKEKREEINGSLRSKGTSGEKLAAPRPMTEAERLECAQALSRLRCTIGNKTGNGAAFEKKT